MTNYGPQLPLLLSLFISPAWSGHTAPGSNPFSGSGTTTGPTSDQFTTNVVRFDTIPNNEFLEYFEENLVCIYIVLDTISMNDRPAKMRKFDCMTACKDRVTECAGIKLASVEDDTNCYLASWSTTWDNSSSNTPDTSYISYIMVSGDNLAMYNTNYYPMTSNRVGEFGFMNPTPPVKPPHPPGPWYGAYWAGMMNMWYYSNPGDSVESCCQVCGVGYTDTDSDYNSCWCYEQQEDETPYLYETSGFHSYRCTAKDFTTTLPFTTTSTTTTPNTTTWEENNEEEDEEDDVEGEEEDGEYEEGEEDYGEEDEEDEGEEDYYEEGEEDDGEEEGEK